MASAVHCPRCSSAIAGWSFACPRCHFHPDRHDRTSDDVAMLYRMHSSARGPSVVAAAARAVGHCVSRAWSHLPRPPHAHAVQSGGAAAPH